MCQLNASANFQKFQLSPLASTAAKIKCSFLERSPPNLELESVEKPPNQRRVCVHQHFDSNSRPWQGTHLLSKNDNCNCSRGWSFFRLLRCQNSPQLNECPPASEASRQVKMMASGKEIRQRRKSAATLRGEIEPLCKSGEKVAKMAREKMTEKRTIFKNLSLVKKLL